MIKTFEKFSYIIATGFGLGLIPKAPGTFGSLLGIPLGIALYGLNIYAALTFILAMTIVCVPIIKQAEKSFNKHDPSAIVVDEIIGQAIPIMFFEPSLQNIIFAFLLFRLFDIIKHGPVGWVDKKIKGPLGVILDDIVAGILATLVLYIAGKSIF